MSQVVYVVDVKIYLSQVYYSFSGESLSADDSRVEEVVRKLMEEFACAIRRQMIRRAWLRPWSQSRCMEVAEAFRPEIANIATAVIKGRVSMKKALANMRDMASRYVDKLEARRASKLSSRSLENLLSGTLENSLIEMEIGGVRKLARKFKEFLQTLNIDILYFMNLPESAKRDLWTAFIAWLRTRGDSTSL